MKFYWLCEMKQDAELFEVAAEDRDKAITICVDHLVKSGIDQIEASKIVNESDFYDERHAPGQIHMFDPPTKIGD
jgi:hypothetical protein